MIFLSVKRSHLKISFEEGISFENLTFARCVLMNDETDVSGWNSMLTDVSSTSTMRVNKFSQLRTVKNYGPVS